ncbi:hypothetical protein ABTO25_20435, partial [Acinetobacter baumannii]
AFLFKINRIYITGNFIYENEEASTISQTTLDGIIVIQARERLIEFIPETMNFLDNTEDRTFLLLRKPKFVLEELRKHAVSNLYARQELPLL